MSSRIAAWGHPPVSTARIRPGSKAPCRTRNSPSSFVKMSLVTAHSGNLIAQPAAKLQHEGGLPTPNRPADAHSKRPPGQVAV